jgi:hypothetical protein
MRYVPDLRMHALWDVRGADRGRGMQRLRREGRRLRLHTKERINSLINLWVIIDYSNARQARIIKHQHH